MNWKSSNSDISVDDQEWKWGKGDQIKRTIGSLKC